MCILSYITTQSSKIVPCFKVQSRGSCTFRRGYDELLHFFLCSLVCYFLLFRASLVKDEMVLPQTQKFSSDCFTVFAFQDFSAFLNNKHTRTSGWRSRKIISLNLQILHSWELLMLFLMLVLSHWERHS